MTRPSICCLAGCVAITTFLGSIDQRESTAADTAGVAEPLTANDFQRLQELETEINGWLLNDADAIQQHLQQAKPKVDSGKIVRIPETAVTSRQAIEKSASRHAAVVDQYLVNSGQADAIRDALLQGMGIAFEKRSVELPEKSYERLKTLSESENADPVIRLLALQESAKRKALAPKELVKQFVELDAVFQSSTAFPPIFRFLQKGWTWQALRSVRPPDVRAERFRQEAFREAARFLSHGNGKISPASHLSAVRLQLETDTLPIAEQKELYEELLRERGIDPWIMHVAAGAFYRNLAWQYRGSGYASTVTDGGQERFAAFMKKASEHYVRAWHLRPELPRAAAELIAIANQTGSTDWTQEEWFVTAISAECDYDNAYTHYTWALMPRWGGSQEQLLDFARQCLATNRWDTRVPLLGMNVIERVQRDVSDDEQLGKNEFAKSLADESLAAFQSAAFMNKVAIEKYVANLCRFAVVELEAGDYVRARLAFDLMGTYGQSRWDTKAGMSFGHAVGLAYALTGPQAERAQAIQTVLSEKQSDLSEPDIRKHLAAVEQLAKDDQEALAAGFYQSAAVVLRQLQQFSSGDWVDLKFEPTMENWLVRADSFDVIDAGTIVLHSAPDFKRAVLQPMARFSPPFLVEAEVKNGGIIDRQAFCGITVGSPVWRSNAAPQTVSVEPDARHIVVEQGHKRTKGQPTGDFRTVKKPLPEFMPLAIRNWPGAIEFFGQHDRIAVDLACEAPSTAHLHFGNVLNGGSTREATFRNLRIRKLPFGPPPADDDLDRNLAYYQRVVELLPESPFDNARLGHFLLRAGKFAEAFVHLQQALKTVPPIKGLQSDLGDYYFEVADYSASSAAFHKELAAYGDEEHVLFRIAWLSSTAPLFKNRDGSKSQRLLGRLNKMLQTDQTPNFRCVLTQAVADAQQNKLDLAAQSSARAIELAKTEDEKAIAETVHAAITSGKPYRMPAKPKPGEIRY